MISSIEWVPAGVADPNPKKYEFSQAELDLIKMMENHTVGEEPETPKEKKKTKLPIMENNLPADLRMDEYSSDEEDNEAVRGAAIGRLLVEDDVEEPQTIAPGQIGNYDDDSVDSDDDLADVPDTREYMPVDLDGLNAMGFSHVGTNAPAYLQDDEEEDDASDAEDVRIRSTDSIVVVAKTEEEFASLEVHVYEQDTGNLFVHHDISLPAFPLCLSHGDISPSGQAGNFCAVGTFGPGIEIWNLDVLNALEPSCVLGGEDTTMADEIMRHNMMNSKVMNQQANNNLLHQQGSPSLKPGSHTDAVMALSWNKVHRQVIASGSADCTVKLWDVTLANTSKACAATLSHHKNKVQSVLWHPQEGTLLATGSYDRTVALVDARATENVKSVKIPGDCEALAWDPHNTHLLTTASEDGTVVCWDVRNFSSKKPLWSMVGSEYGGVSDLAYNDLVPGMLATSAVDKTVTLWDTSTGESPRAKMNKDMKVGKLFTLNFYPSSPWLLGCAGGGKEIAIWDMREDATVQKCFGGRQIANSNTASSTEATSPQKESTESIIDSVMASDSNAVEKKSVSAKKNKKKKKKKWRL
mmetsp:Transcript_10391/g.26130  ORF Transcript_10391/g.26130 Transcript_10391/m.26130 type:complete len:582 (-) Transcript_10391:1357-3102(-)